MVDKVLTVIERYDGMVKSYEEKSEELPQKIEFYEEYGFKEEKRIALVEWEANAIIVSNFRSMLNEIKSLLN